MIGYADKKDVRNCTDIIKISANNRDDNYYRYHTKTHITSVTMITDITVFTPTKKGEIIGVIQGL